MVNKMNLKTKFLIGLLSCLPVNIYGAELGFSAIKQRNYVVCGINADYNYLSYKKEGRWEGLDADMCRVIAQAVLQDSESFKLLPVKSDKIGKLLNSGTIDVMLGHEILSPQLSAQQNIASTDIVYYDKIVLAVRNKKPHTSSLKNYTGAKVCVQDHSIALENITRYNDKYNLGFSFLKFPQLSAVKSSFYLKRCDLVVGDEIYITGIVKDLHSEEAKVLPEELSILPIKYYTSGNNNYFNIAVNNAFQSLRLAAAEGITSNNIDTFKVDKSASIQNILGFNPKFWSQLNLDPSWLNKYLQNYGNYYDVIERNIGYGSPLNLKTSYSTSYKKGGFGIDIPLL